MILFEDPNVNNTWGLCVKGLGVIQTSNTKKAAEFALKEAKKYNMYSIESLYIENFETGEIIS